jgi:uncharacterized membrane protein YqjE
MRLLWSLPKAAPALLRHLLGYAELVVQDLEDSQHHLAARLVAGAVLGLSLFFLVLCLCLLVVALTWDTPRRVPAICWMLAGFFVIALFAGLYRSTVVRDRVPLLATVRKEWSEDRVILERILAPDEE